MRACESSGLVVQGFGPRLGAFGETGQLLSFHALFVLVVDVWRGLVAFVDPGEAVDRVCTCRLSRVPRLPDD